MDQLALSGMGKYGNVVLIRKAGGEGSKVPLFDKQSIFGSGDNCDIRIRNSSVENEHARLFIDSHNKAWIECLQPSAQIEVAGKLLQQRQCRIKNGTMIKIGNKTFVYKKSDIIIDTPNKMDDKENTPDKYNDNTGILIPGLDCQQVSAKKLKHIRRRSYQLEKSYVDDEENDGQEKQIEGNNATEKHEEAVSSTTTPHAKSMPQTKQEVTKTTDIKTIPDIDQLWNDCVAGKLSICDSSKKVKTRRSGEKHSLLPLQTRINNDQTKLVLTNNCQNNNNLKTPEKKILNQVTSVNSLMKTVDELFIPKRNRKSVTFGPHLSPELFNKKNPTDTPLRRGSKPVYTPMPSASKSKNRKRRTSILKTPGIVDHLKQSNDLSDVVSNLNFASNDLLSLQESEINETTNQAETLTTSSQSNDDLISIDPVLNLSSASSKILTKTNVKRRSFQSNNITRRHSSGIVQKEESNKKKNLKRLSNDWVLTLGDRRTDDVLLTEMALRNKNQKRKSSQRKRSSQNTCKDSDRDNNNAQSMTMERKIETPNTCNAEAHHFMQNLLATPNIERLNDQLIDFNTTSDKSAKATPATTTVVDEVDTFSSPALMNINHNNSQCDDKTLTPLRDGSESQSNPIDLLMTTPRLSTSVNDGDNAEITALQPSNDNQVNEMDVKNEENEDPINNTVKVEEYQLSVVTDQPCSTKNNNLRRSTTGDYWLPTIGGRRGDDYLFMGAFRSGNTKRNSAPAVCNVTDHKEDRRSSYTPIPLEKSTTEENQQDTENLVILEDEATSNNDESPQLVLDENAHISHLEKESNQILTPIKTLPSSYDEIEGLKNLFKTPKLKNNSTDDNLCVLKQWLKTPKSKRDPTLQPVYDGLQRLLQTPKVENKISDDYSTVMQQWFKTPTSNKNPSLEPVFNGLQELFQTPSSLKFTTSPVSKIKMSEVSLTEQDDCQIQTPVKMASTEYDIMEGLQNLFKTPKFKGKSCDENLLTLKQWLKTPRNKRDPEVEPVYEELQQLLKTPKLKGEISDENLSTLKQWFRTPKRTKNRPLEPIFDGLEQLFKTPKKSFAETPSASDLISTSTVDEATMMDISNSDENGHQIQTPNKVLSDKNDVESLQNLFKTPRFKNKPCDENLLVLKQWLKTPKNKRDPELEPVYDGLQRLLKTPKLKGEISNEGLSTLKQWFNTPKSAKNPSLEPVFDDLTDLFKTPMRTDVNPNILQQSVTPSMPMIDHSEEDLGLLKEWLKTPKRQRDPALEEIYTDVQSTLETSIHSCKLAEEAANCDKQNEDDQVVEMTKPQSVVLEENLAVLKQWFKTPKSKKSAALESVFEGLSELFKTPKQVSTDISNSDISVKQQMQQTTDVEIKNFEDNLDTLSEWCKTPKSKRNPLLEPLYEGLKELFTTPTSQMKQNIKSNAKSNTLKKQRLQSLSPDCSFMDARFSILKEWFKTPKTDRDPSVEPIVDGLQQLFQLPFYENLNQSENTESQLEVKTPKSNNKIDSAKAFKQWLKTPETATGTNFELTSQELQKIFATPKSKSNNSDKNLSVLKQWLKTPKTKTENELSLEGDELTMLFQTPKQGRRRSKSIGNTSVGLDYGLAASINQSLNQKDSDESINMMNSVILNDEDVTVYNLQNYLVPSSSELCETNEVNTTVTTAIIEPVDETTEQNSNINELEQNVEDEGLESLKYLLKTPRKKLNAQSIADRDNILMALKNLMKTPSSKQDKEDVHNNDGCLKDLKKFLKTPRSKKHARYSMEAGLLPQLFVSSTEASSNQQQIIFRGLKELFQSPKKSNEAIDEFLTELTDLFTDTSADNNQQSEDNKVETLNPVSEVLTVSEDSTTVLTKEEHVDSKVNKNESITSEIQPANPPSANIEKRQSKRTKSKATNAKRASTRKSKQTIADTTEDVVVNKTESVSVRSSRKRKITDSAVEEPVVKKLRKNKRKATKRIYESKHIEQKPWNNVVFMTPIVELSETEMVSCEKNNSKLSTAKAIKGKKSKKCTNAKEEKLTDLICNLEDVKEASSVDTIPPNEENIASDSCNVPTVETSGRRKSTRASKRRNVAPVEKKALQCGSPIQEVPSVVAVEDKDVMNNLNCSPVVTSVENKSTTRLSRKRKNTSDNIDDDCTAKRNLRQKNQMEKKETVIEESKPKETVNEESKPKETVIEESKPKETVIEESKSKETVIEESKPKETVIEESKPKETVIEESKPKETFIEETKRRVTRTRSKAMKQETNDEITATDNEVVLPKRSRLRSKKVENCSNEEIVAVAPSQDNTDVMDVQNTRIADKQVEEIQAETTKECKDNNSSSTQTKRKNRKIAKPERQQKNEAHCNRVATRSSGRSTAVSEQSEEMTTTDNLLNTTRKSRRLQVKDSSVISNMTSEETDKPKTKAKITRKVKAAKISPTLPIDDETTTNSNRRSRRLANKSVPN